MFVFSFVPGSGTGSIVPALLTGVAEETGKVLALLLLAYTPRYRWQLNGAGRGCRGAALGDRRDAARALGLELAVAKAGLETFPNPRPGREYTIVHTCPEFTAVCPKTGQPDFGTIRISYVPDRTCVELKSLKLYLFSFRNRGIFYEDVTNLILDDLVAALSPRRMTVEGDFNVRGGISSVVRVEYEAPRRRRRR